MFSICQCTVESITNMISRSFDGPPSQVRSLDQMPAKPCSRSFEQGPNKDARPPRRNLRNSAIVPARVADLQLGNDGPFPGSRSATRERRAVVPELQICYPGTMAEFLKFRRRGHGARLRCGRSLLKSERNLDLSLACGSPDAVRGSVRDHTKST